MRKCVCLLLCLLLALPLGGQCEAMDDQAQWFHDQSRALAVLMGEAAQNADYTGLYASGAIQEKATALGRMDFDAPLRLLLWQGEALDQALRQMADAADLALSPALRQQARRRMLNAVPSALAGYAGAENLAAATILTMETACAAPEWLRGDALALLEYGGDTAVMVCFFLLDTGVAVISAMPVSQAAAAENLPEASAQYSF